MIGKLLTLALGSFLTPVANSSPVTVNFAVDVTSVYDYPSRSYTAFAPISGAVSMTFDADLLSITDHGQATITTFGGVLGTAWASPVTSLIPADPYSGAYGSFYNSYTFPNVTDFPTSFIEEAAAQANTYWSNGTNYAAYHIEARATRRLPARTGDGTSDYAFSRETLLDFYRSFQASGEPVYFNESYQVYTLVNGSAVYSEGKSWSSYTARVSNVIDHAAPVPEPSTWAMLGAGLFILTIQSRRGT